MAQVANEKTASGAAHSATDSAFQHKSRNLPLALGTVGVVYGDIGTSPLYALRECLRPGHGLPLTLGTVLGLL